VIRAAWAGTWPLPSGYLCARRHGPHQQRVHQPALVPCRVLVTSPRSQGTALRDERAEKGVLAPQPDAIEIADDDAVRLPQRHLRIWHAFGRALGGDEGLHLAEVRAGH
jgi:hypothetical protein